MRHSWTKVSLLAASALVVPASLGVVALPGVASATVPSGSAACTAATLVVTTSAKLTLQDCTDTGVKATGSTGTLNAAAIAPGSTPVTTKITWASKGTTTVKMTVKESTVKSGQGSCTTGFLDFVATGTVTKSTKGTVAPNTGALKVNAKVSASLCVNTTTYVVKFVTGTGGFIV